MNYFLRISDRTLLGKLLRLPLRLIPAEARMPILQGRLKGKKWIVGSLAHGCWLGSYEHETRVVFEKMVTEGSIVFDIGAHVGFYTLLAAVLVGPDGRVFAFEPVPQNLLYLREHLRLNRITNVTVIEAAVADCSGVVLFDEGPSISKTGTKGMGRISPKGKLQVKTVSLDELIFSNEIPVPDYIKIDVEGAERQVLSGAKSMLANAHPILFLATHGRTRCEQCCQFLRSLGYLIVTISEESSGTRAEILAYGKGVKLH